MDDSKGTPPWLDVLCRLGWRVVDGLYFAGLPLMAAHAWTASRPGPDRAAPDDSVPDDSVPEPLTGPAPLHPERVCAAPPSPQERMLWRQLEGAGRAGRPGTPS